VIEALGDKYALTRDQREMGKDGVDGGRNRKEEIKTHVKTQGLNALARVSAQMGKDPDRIISLYYSIESSSYHNFAQQGRYVVIWLFATKISKHIPNPRINTFSRYFQGSKDTKLLHSTMISRYNYIQPA
jgi:hypothetical protein